MKPRMVRHGARDEIFHALPVFLHGEEPGYEANELALGSSHNTMCKYQLDPGLLLRNTTLES